MNTDALVSLWGNPIGAVTWDEERMVGVFQYMPEFLSSGIELAPLVMPLAPYPYAFPALPKETFYGLPGLLADSLPDKWGNAVINAWLDAQGRDRASMNPVERLCTIGSRGMGGLEFEPALFGTSSRSRIVQVENLVSLANKVLAVRGELAGVLSGEDDKEALEGILRVGTSAGGARAKAILAWHPQTGKFRSGQLAADSGYQYWILKFDGVSNNRDKELADPKGFGKIEYAYSLMAGAAGIVMMPCRLHAEHKRRHFMTKRFDRTDAGEKLHMQTLGAMAHLDYNQPASSSYEQAIQVMRRLDLPRADLEQQVRRAFFNVIARNQDDHVKNITFLMDQAGVWRLSPAYDVTYAYDPQGMWTQRHQMSLNGKREGLEREDLLAFAAYCGIKSGAGKQMLADVLGAVSQWEIFAEQAEVASGDLVRIQKAHRTHI